MLLCATINTRKAFMKKKIVSLFASLMILLAPALAFAADAQPAAVRAIDNIVQVGLYAVGLVLMLLLGKLVYTLEKRWKVKLPQIATDTLHNVIDQGIHYAQEQARKALKTNGKKLEMSDTLEHAATFVMDLADKKQVAEMGKEKIKRLIESRLNSNRAYSESLNPTPTPDVIENLATVVKVEAQ